MTHAGTNGTHNGYDLAKGLRDSYEINQSWSSEDGVVLSVIVPTKNESGNVGPLIQRLSAAANGLRAEVIFVDDSTDNTPAAITEAASDCRLPVAMLHRAPERRGDGLGGAVRDGMSIARGEWVCVMDGDLQHPPELVPELLESATVSDAEIAIASRYADREKVLGLEKGRSFVSKLCIAAARVVFPRRLRNVSDPLSGFFLVRKGAVDALRLRPRGFKILLEILVRFPRLKVVEIPFVFRTRNSGKSKAALREGIRYLMLLSTLRVPALANRAFRFAVVGASGLIVNQVLLVSFTDLAGIFYLLSAALATQGSSLWNFSLTEAWVFDDRRRKEGRLRRLGQFMLMNNGTLILRGPFLVILTSGFGVHYFVSNLLTLLVLALARYLTSDVWIWSRMPSRELPASPVADGELAGVPGKNGASEPVVGGFCYDIHGILRVRSPLRLPELDYFRTPRLSGPPDLNIEIGRGKEPKGQTSSFEYKEIVGPLGFWVTVSGADSIEVRAGRLLQWSPHVLYTNIVEPILRWMLVRRGYALVHAACMESEGGAVLITAATDTGKTTTLLRTLSRPGQTFKFLSDDMVIVSRDGYVLNYPKPLTISRHTLEAVSGAPLSMIQRLALQVQSRVHSKSGRKTALALTRTRLPMASINTIAQILVPPPKYYIETLIPEVTVSSRIQAAQLVIIDRAGDDAEEDLDRSEAMEVLFRNCEDAYGFPPYESLAKHLHHWGGTDLRPIEHDIITDALSGCSATLLRRQQRDWWLRLPGVLSRVQVAPEPVPDAGAGS
jgi:glycosyltransferase involved in cell wall biosynthesis